MKTPVPMLPDATDMTMRPARDAALDRMQRFVPRAGRDYAATRNFDFGPGNRGNVSMLSPYLRHRLVTETELLGAVLEHRSPAASGKFVEEVFWRAYFKGWLEHHPTVWRDYRRDTARLVGRLDTDPRLRTCYEEAVSGNTGIACFDAWAVELVETGYLHNHARMWFASIWVFTLGLPWQLGADFFYRHLLDGDPASNTLGWRWVCGLHTKGKTYLARASNIAKYTDNRFDPSERLAASAPPLTEDTEHAVRPLRQVPDAEPAGNFGLLVTEEDCCPQSLGVSGVPRQLFAAVATEARSPLPVGRPARSFASGAVSDALARAEDAYGIRGVFTEEPGDDWGTMLADWATQNELTTIVTAHAPVGPVAERLAGARDALGSRGIRLLEIRREYDALAWPHASRGFFRLKSEIPGILQRLGLIGPARAAKSAAS